MANVENSDHAKVAVLKRTLPDVDSELFNLIRKEKERQRHCVELIASENFTSQAVMECLGSCLTNKYSEGYSGARYYGGNEVIDEIENLCKKRALQAFDLDDSVWAINVQPYSGSPANLAAYVGLLKPHDRIMGLDLPSGGHLTHGFYTPKKKVSATSIFFESLPYTVDAKTGWIDYDSLHKTALIFRPKLIIAGLSAYPRDLDYKRFREICDDVGALLLADIAHISGLIAAKLLNNPFDHCDVVTSTSHKTLRGPRSGIIFSNKQRVPNIHQSIDEAVFPSLQGGPHNHQVAALACQLKEVASPAWRQYAEQVLLNAKALAEALLSKGYTLATDGTDNHIVLWDLSPTGMTGSKMQLICDASSITLNKNAIRGDKSAANPSGLRIGSPAMTSRGLVEADFRVIAEFLHQALTICKNTTQKYGTKLVDFRKGIPNDETRKLAAEVEAFAGSFYLPGFPDI